MSNLPTYADNIPEDYFNENFSSYADDIAFCFRIIISSQDITNEKSDIVDYLYFGTLNSMKNEQFFDAPALGVEGSTFSYFWAEPHKMTQFFYESLPNIEWTLNIGNSGTLTFTRLGTDDKIIPNTASLEIFATGSEQGTPIVNGTTRMVVAGQTYTIRYIHKLRSDVKKDLIYTFQPGWNLLSLPIVFYEDQPRENDNWDMLLALPRFTLSGRTFVQNGKIRCGEAFWVFYQTGDFDNNTLTILGYEPLPSDWPNRTSGWNFIAQGIPDSPADSVIYEWNTTDGRYQITTDTAVPQKGSWLK